VAVHKLAETSLEPLRFLKPENGGEAPQSAPPTEQPVKTKDREQRDAAILIQTVSTIAALAKIVSVRLVMLLTAIGAFYLALAAAMHPTVPAIAIMGLFCALIFVPVVLLESGILARLKS
jgi:hypothetical protein